MLITDALQDWVPTLSFHQLKCLALRIHSDSRFANDITVEDLIASNNKSAYQVYHVMAWGSENGLQHNISKIKEIVVYFRRKRDPASLLIINGEVTKQIHHFRFLGFTF